MTGRHHGNRSENISRVSQRPISGLPRRSRYSTLRWHRWDRQLKFSEALMTLLTKPSTTCGEDFRHRSGTVDECQQAMHDFESRRQSESESLAEFEQVLRILHREAWPDQSDEQLDPVLKRRFEEGVAFAELRQYLRLYHRDLDFGKPRRKLVYLQPRWARRKRRRVSGL